jgi:hypothetical protein
MRLITKARLTVAGAFVLAMTAAPAFAIGASNPHANAATGDSSHGMAMGADDPAAQADSNKPDNPGSQAGTKLADAKLRVCQHREKSINNIMARIADRGQKQLDLFTSIATRTEDFYTSKGKTLSNYDALVSDVNTQRAAAQSEVDTIKSDSVSFKCDGTDPKGAAQAFKDDLKLEMSALKTYRTAVKNLIVGVSSVQGTTSSGDNGAQGGQQ